MQKIFVWMIILCGFSGNPAIVAAATTNGASLLIGWAAADITPAQPVLIGGQFHARVSEGVLDPITATVLTLESPAAGTKLAMVSCDLISISEFILQGIREHVSRALPDLPPESILVFATHTHTAPLTAVAGRYGAKTPANSPPYGIRLPVMPPEEYTRWLNRRVADAVIESWNSRAPGGIAWGLTYAAVGRNRIIAQTAGKSKMYARTDQAEFSHVEGFEDHSLNVMATYDRQQRMTGLILNLACPAQVSEASYKISADFWHDTRIELRDRLGSELHVLPQCSAAGDQSPHILLNKPAEARMLQLQGLTTNLAATLDYNLNAPHALRRQIALRISDSVASILPILTGNVDFAPVLRHKMMTVELPRRRIPDADAAAAAQAAVNARAKFEEMRQALDQHPEKRGQPRWYTDITRAHSLMRRDERVVERHALQNNDPLISVELHCATLGATAFASNPFELYLDYGLQIKERSPATQTFLIQLAGPGSYLPTERSVAGGAYGAVPASTEIGPPGGALLVELTLDAIGRLCCMGLQQNLPHGIELPAKAGVHAR